MWSALGYQRWTNRDDTWVMSGEYQNVISPGSSTMDKQRWPMGDDHILILSTHHPWVISVCPSLIMTHGLISDTLHVISPWVIPVYQRWTNRDDPWVMSGEYQNVISPGLPTMDKQRWPMGDEWRVSECDQPWVINDGQTDMTQRWPMGDEWRVSECDQPWVTNDGQTEMTHGWWVESIRMWSALGYQRWEMTHGWWVESIRMWSALGFQRWTNRDDPWVMSGEYQNVISPGLPTMDKQRWPMGDEWSVLKCDQPWVINDGQTEMTHGWWVESIRMWSALGYQRWTNRDDPWVMSGEYQNVISPGLSTMDKQRWPMGDEWRVSECDQPWVINDGQTEMTHGWWVESIRMWSALGYQRWTNRDDPWVMSGEYQNVISPGFIHRWSYPGLITNRDDPWVMSGEWSECDQPWVINDGQTRWPMGDEWRVSECDQPWVTNDGQTEMTHGWCEPWLPTMDKQRWPMGDDGVSLPMDQPWVINDWYPRADTFWTCDQPMGSQRWTNRDDPWADEYSECDQPWVINWWTNRDDPWAGDQPWVRQTEMTHGLMSGEYQNVISPGLSTMDKQRWPMGDQWRVSECDQPWVHRYQLMDKQRWPMGDEWRVSECDQPWFVHRLSTQGWWFWTNMGDDPWVMSGFWVLRMWSAHGLSTMDKRRWPMGDEWRVLECDQPWVHTNDGQTEMTHGWWVSIPECDQPWVYQRWTNRDDPWVMSLYQNHWSALGWSHSDTLHSWPMGHESESIRMWSALGWSQRYSPLMTHGWRVSVQPCRFSDIDGQTEMTHGWWVETLHSSPMGMWWPRAALGLLNMGWTNRDDPMGDEWSGDRWWPMGADQVLILWSALGYQRWTNDDDPWVKWRVSECDHDDKQLITHGWWWTECDHHPWVTLIVHRWYPRADHTWITHGSSLFVQRWPMGWWVLSMWSAHGSSLMVRWPMGDDMESIRMWSALGYQRWTNRDDPGWWVESIRMWSAHGLSCLSIVGNPGLITFWTHHPWVISVCPSLVTQGWSHSDTQNSSPMGSFDHRWWPRVMSGEYQNVITGSSLFVHRW